MATNNAINAPLPISVPNGGSGRATGTTAYAPICVGTTATGTQQTADTGLATAGFVFTSNGNAALPSFQTVGASATGLVHITSGTATSQVNLEFKQCFTSSYNNYRILFNNYVPATSGSLLLCNVGYGATPTYIALNYNGSLIAGTGNVVAGSASPTTYIELAANTYNVASIYGAGGWFEIYNVNDTTNGKSGTTHCYYLNTTPANSMFIQGILVSDAHALTSVKFATSSGNITSLNVVIYGYN